MNRLATLTPMGGLALAAFTVTVAIASVVLSPNASTASVAVPKNVPATGAALSGIWALDRGHTEIGFTVGHLGVARTHGRFTDFNGTFKVDGVKPENSSVSVDIRTASINTDDENRDKHLRGADFFDTGRYPEMTFRSTGVKKTKDGDYIAYGDLTIKDVTKPIALRFTPTPPIQGRGGKLRTGLSTGLTIDRRDYGLTWNGLVEGTQAVGNEVEIQIDLEAVKG